MGQTIPKMQFCMTVFLAFLVVSASLPQAQASVFTQIRYMTTDPHFDFMTGTAYDGLLTYQSAKGVGYDFGRSLNATTHTKVQNGIRVWLWEYNGSVGTELTSGTPIAVVERTSAGEGLQNATWTPPLTNLTRTQYFEVRVYYRRFVVIWLAWTLWTGINLGLSADFITESLGMTQLLNASWNVYYYTAFKTAGTFKWFEYYWGNATYNSRIENIQLEDGVTAATNNLPSGFMLGAIITIPIGIILAITLKKRH